VIGYQLAGGQPVEKYRLPTVRQPNSVAVDPDSGRVFVASAERRRYAGDATMSDGVIDGDWEYRPLRLPAAVSRRTAATHLAIHAEFSGWELSRVLLYSDGTRKVWAEAQAHRVGVRLEYLSRSSTPPKPGQATW